MLTIRTGVVNHIMKLFPQQTSFNPRSTLRKVGLSIVFSLTTIVAALPGQAIEFPEMGDRGAPERTSGGGTRGDRCAADIDDSIQALVPRNNVSTFAGPQAKLWLHMPAELTLHTAEVFVKHPDTHKVVYEYQTALPKLERDGLIELILPAEKADGSPLIDDNQNYFWEFAIICDANDRARDRFIQGFLYKIASDEALDTQLDAAHRTVEPLPSDFGEFTLEMLASAGLWQDTLSLAIYSPKDWNELLLSVGLEELANSNHTDSEIEFVQRLSLPLAEY